MCFGVLTGRMNRAWPVVLLLAGIACSLSPGTLIRSFGEGARGELYIMTQTALYRIVPGP